MREIYVEKQFQKFRKLVVATKFSQVYNGIADVVLGMSSSISLRLLFWIMEKMDDNNFVVFRKAEKLEFIYECYKAGSEKKSISSINRSVKELVDKGLMVSINNEGERLGKFFVNPGYFWKSKNQHERSKRIKEYYEYLKFKTNEAN